jgi:RNA polymerase sigma-70 factor (ECF subfamily)
VVSDQRQWVEQAEQEVVAKASFATFVREQSPGLFGAVRLLSRDRAEARDVVEQAFLKVWDRWDRVRTTDDPVGYLYRTALVLQRKRWRRLTARFRRSSMNGDQVAIEEEARDPVLRALAELSDDQRQSLVLIDLFAFPSKEVGRLMGLRPATVRDLASQGRRRLKALLGDADA